MTVYVKYPYESTKKTNRIKNENLVCSQKIRST